MVLQRGLVSDSSGREDGSVASDFLRDRMRLYGKVSFVLSLVFYFMVNFLSPGGLASIANLSILGVAAILGSLWLVCRLPLTHAALLRVDAAAIIAVGIGCAIHGWAAGQLDLRYNALLAPTNVLAFRAVLIPMPARRTFWLGLLAVLPVVAPAWVRYFGASPTTPELQLEMALFTGWGFNAVILATVVSHVVHGLQRSLRKARRLGQYRLVEKIGEGGMGEVHLAHHALLRRPTAIKLLRPDRTGEASIQRFEREVQVTSQLTHPNTVAIYDFGRTPEGIFYYAMEYLPGLNLDQLVRSSGPQPAPRVVHLLRQICGALAEAHGAGLVHRDVKAANVILCERGGIRDVAKVVDFGLVQASDDSADQKKAIRGTADYLAPEVITSPQEVDARADLYAVGVLGYYLLTGTPPFDANTFVDLCAHHVSTEPEPPSARLGLPVPADLESLVLGCMEKEPARRPQSAQILYEALSVLQESCPWGPADIAKWWADNEPRDPGPISELPTLSSADLNQRVSVLVDAGDISP